MKLDRLTTWGKKNPELARAGIALLGALSLLVLVARSDIGSCLGDVGSGSDCEITEFDEADLIPKDMKTPEARDKMQQAWESTMAKVDRDLGWLQSDAAKIAMGTALAKKTLNPAKTYRNIKSKIASVRYYSNFADPNFLRQHFSEDEINYARHIEEVSGVKAELLIALRLAETLDSDHVMSSVGAMGADQHMPKTARGAGERVFYDENKVDLSENTIQVDGVTVTVGRAGDYRDTATDEHYMPEDQRKSDLHHMAATAVIAWRKAQRMNGDYLEGIAKYNGAPGLDKKGWIEMYVLNAFKNGDADIQSRTYVLKVAYALLGACALLEETPEEGWDPYASVEVKEAIPLATLHDGGFGLEDLYEGSLNADLLIRVPLSEITRPLIIPDIHLNSSSEGNKSGFGTKTLIKTYFKSYFKRHLKNSDGIQNNDDGTWTILPGTFKDMKNETSVDTSFTTRGKFGLNPPTLSDLPIPIEEIINANPNLFGVDGGLIDPGIQSYMKTTSLRPGYRIKFASRSDGRDFCSAIE